MSTETKPQQKPIAIIGMGCMFPKANDPECFWSNIREGVDTIEDIPESHWRVQDYFDQDPASPDKTFGRRGGFLDAVDFNPIEFGISPKDIEATDTTQLLGLLVTRQALRDAGYGATGRSFDRERTSVILGVTGTLELVIPLGARLGHPIWRRALTEAGVDNTTAENVVQRIADSYVEWQENSFPGLLGNVVAGRIANRLDLHGTNCVVDAACASSLSALHLAVLELETGRSDMVISGGMDTFNSVFMYTCFSKTPALSPTQDAKPFDNQADGTILGEGLGVLVLKRLDDAERDGDKIYAVLKGLGSSSDGKGMAVYAPSADGQSRALSKAYQNSGLSPNTVELVEGHGTGTKVGDATEIRGLCSVYRQARQEGTWCALGSVKSMIGHTKAAAGSAGLIKAAMALRHKVLPPTIKVTAPNEAMAESTPFYLNTQKRPWLPRAEHPRRAAVSSFGFGGSNFHCVLEEYQHEQQEIDWDGQIQLWAFSADSQQQLLQAMAAVTAPADWQGVRQAAAKSRQLFRSDQRCRLALVVQKGGSALRDLLSQAQKTLRTNAEANFWFTPLGIYYCQGDPAGDLALLFSGQGAQYVGMLRDLSCQFPQMQETLAQADTCFGNDSTRLSDHIYPRPVFAKSQQEQQANALTATQVAQPALGAVGLGCYGILQHFGIQPQAAAGHSYGELVALCAAGRITPKQMHRLSRLRGELMATGEGDRGSMLAVLAAAKRVEQFLAEHDLDLVIANKNAPEQTVLSGSTAEIERAIPALSTSNLRGKRLQVSAAFHSPLVAGAAAPFAQALSEIEFAPSTFPVFANSTADTYPESSAQASQLLAEQLAKPVEFVQLIENMYNTGIRTYIELGPGRRLTGLVSEILDRDDVAAAAIDASSGQGHDVVGLARVLALLAVRGHRVELQRWDESAASVQEQPTKKPAFHIAINGANYVGPKKLRDPKPRPKNSPQSQPKTVAAEPAAAPQEAIATPQSPTTTAQQVPPPVQAATQVPPMPQVKQTVPPPQAALDQTAAPSATVLSQAISATQQNLNALVQLQQQTAQLHQMFLQSQEQASRSFQTLVNQQQNIYAPVLNTPQAVATQPSSTPTTPLPPLQVPAVEPAATPAVQPAAQPFQVQPSTDHPTQLQAAEQSSDPHSKPQDSSTSELNRDSVSRVLLGVIAEKTGYPAEMLEPSMGLNTDLGIDSIKRVEILSALEQSLPEAPSIQPEHLGELQTLEQMIDFLTAGTVVAKQPATQPADLPAPAAANLNQKRVAEVVLSVVAEKTGYPADMLELSMTLNTDLGIDSIKRVEILSTLQQHLPEASVIEPEHLGALQTLGQVVEFLAQGQAEKPAAQPQLAAESPPEKKPEPRSQSLRQPTLGVDRYQLQARSLPAASNQDAWNLAAGPVLVSKTDDGLAGAIVEHLSRRGKQAELVDLSPPPQPPENLAGLIVVTPERNSDEQFMLQAFAMVQALGPKLQQVSQGQALLATVSRLDGAFGLKEAQGDVTSAGLGGLAKTVQHEWPQMRCHSVDLDPAINDLEWAGDSIVSRLLDNSPLEVGIRHQASYTLELGKSAHGQSGSKGGVQFGPEDLILVTGGARGVTAEVAVALAQAGQPELVLLGRSEPPSPEPEWLSDVDGEAQIKRAILDNSEQLLAPRQLEEEYQRRINNREVWSNMQRIREAGSPVIYKQLDVCDERAVKTTVAQLSAELGPITGLVHGAGVLADGLIPDKKAEDFVRVYRTKVQAMDALCRALANASLKAIVVFSSSTARFGRRGQVDYAVANEVLNKFAQQQDRQRPRCRVLSINWGPWAGGMVTPPLQQLFKAEGVEVIGLKQGARFLLDELAAEAAAVEVLVLGVGSRVPKDSLQQNHPAVAKPELRTVFERSLSVSNHPFLRSHVMDGKAVLPLAVSIEWLAHGALHGNPGLRFRGFENLRFLRGVLLDAEETVRIYVAADRAQKRGDTFVVPVELGSGDSDHPRLHVSADIILGNRLPTPVPALTTSSHAPFEGTIGEVYNQVLFHGPQMQGLQAIGGCDNAGIDATAGTSPSPKEWITDPVRSSWIAEPMAIDCAFQMMILWSFDQSKLGSLPTFARSYQQYRATFPKEPVHINIEVIEHSSHQARANIDWVDAKGELVARLLGYECTIDSALNNAFRSNTLKPQTALEV